VINPSYYRKINYDAVKEFAPITLMAFSPHVLSVNSFDAGRQREGADRAGEEQPRQIQLCVGRPPGNRHARGGAVSKLAYGLDIVHVPFNGGAPAMAATIGAIRRSPSMRCHPPRASSRNGKVRPLAMTSAARDPEFPDVPTFCRGRRAEPGERLSSSAPSRRPEP